MKKTLIYIISIVVILITIIMSKYYSYKESQSKIQENNLRYEKYLDKEIKGRDIATLINQAVDDNEKFFIKKNEKGKYILDEENSVNVEIKITDFAKERIYTMETLYNGGMSEFVKYYGEINFKSEKIQYHKNGKISYILLGQIKE